MNGRYKLDGKTPVEVDDLMEWAKWMEAADRYVGKTSVGVVKVSTVFLGLDHGFGSHHPVLFETMVFGGKLDQDDERYSTWDAAEAGHVRWVEKVRQVEASAP